MNQIVVAPELGEIVAAFVRASNEHLTTSRCTSKLSGCMGAVRLADLPAEWSPANTILGDTANGTNGLLCAVCTLFPTGKSSPTGPDFAAVFGRRLAGIRLPGLRHCCSVV